MAFLLLSNWLPASKHRDEIDGQSQIRWGLDDEVSKGGGGIRVGMDGDRRAFGGLVLLDVPLPRHLGLLAVATAHG